MKIRKGGFTLVELLIVIMIIAILAGMMMLSAGSAVDSAETARIISDLRNLKSAALLFFADTMRWPAASDITSLDRYSDRAFAGAAARYDAVIIGTGYTVNGVMRTNIGLRLKDSATQNIRDKLASKAADTGLLGASGANTVYSGGTEVYMYMR
ncbi:MAG: prepilin-type N-terminal cleavage/methylation domain-containing protein [Synergistaceae bacterium]|jgi:general secretion pathway protein G|nr:prepilin-type N-terminal cleavage/methylation domain-containing protein [Synergistaceae bacterium]